MAISTGVAIRVCRAIAIRTIAIRVLPSVPRRRTASQPSHATPMRRLMTRLLPSPLLLSTECATSLSKLPRLVQPRRCRLRLLRLSSRQSGCRPAYLQTFRSPLRLRMMSRPRLLPLAGHTPLHTPSPRRGMEPAGEKAREEAQMQIFCCPSTHRRAYRSPPPGFERDACGGVVVTPGAAALPR